MAVAVCALVTSAAMGGQAGTSRICDSAVWAAHVDIAAMTKSAMATGMMELVTSEDSTMPADKAKKVVQCWEKIGKVKSVTLFGPSIDKTEAILLADLVEYDRTEVETMLGVADGAQTNSHGDHTLIAFTPKKHRRRAQEAGPQYVCFYNAKTIVVGGDLKRLGEALDLLDGKGKALAADSELAGLLTPSKGSIMVAAVTGVKGLVASAEKKFGASPVGPGATMMKNAQSVRMEIGELEATMSVAINGVMATEQDAQNLQRMGEGLLAVIGMRAQENKDVAAFLQAIKLSSKGKTVSVGISMPVEDVLSKIQAEMLLKAAGAI